MADVITGNTQLVASKNDLIISLVQKELAFNAKLMPTLSDYSAFAGKGSKSVSVPRLSSFTVQNRASGVAGDIQALSTLKDTIDLDYKAYVSWLIDSDDEYQTAIEAQMEFALRAAAAHGRKFDELAIAGMLAGAGLNVGPGPITRDKILDAREFILGNDGDMSKIYMAIGPDSEKAMLKIDEFTNSQYMQSGIVLSGQIGRVYGMPVIVHNGIAAGEALFWEQNGYGFAIQKQPKMAEQPEVAYGTSAKRVAMDTLFGQSILQENEKAVGAGKSPLIVKMA